METVQIQCGNCGKVMAIALQHLGTQVHCPPLSGDRAGTAAARSKPFARHLARVRRCRVSGETWARWRASLPGRRFLEDLSTPGLGVRWWRCRRQPRVASRRPRKAELDLPTITEAIAPRQHRKDPQLLARQGQRNAVRLGRCPHRAARPARQARFRGPPEYGGRVNALEVRSPHRPEPRGLMVPILLIFLIPYSILATAVIAYLLYTRGIAFDPLETLPDPKPNEGPRRAGRSYQPAAR